MSFRDDHDAALARAAALEAENARLREENERLKQPPAPAPKKPAPRKPRSKPAISPGALAAIGGGIALTALVAMVILSAPGRPEDRRADRIGARNAHHDRWRALVWVEPCLRGAENDLRWALRYTPDRHDPRAPGAWVDVRSMVDRLGGRCTSHALALIADPALSAAARRALTAWGDADRRLGATRAPVADYYGERDWMEDDFAGAAALWRRLDAPLEAWRAAKAEVEQVALPAIRAEIAALVAAHEQAAGRDETWWRVHVGLAIWDLLATCHAAMRDSERGGAIDAAAVRAACREPAAKVLALGREAPLEVRRALRDFQSYTLEPLAAGTAADPAETLGQLQYTPRDLILSIDREAIPAMPPELP